MFSVSPMLPEQGFRLLLLWSNGLLALSVLLVIAAALICYPFEQWFSMSQLIASHLSLIASATLMKISYVGRCVAQYSLKQEVR